MAAKTDVPARIAAWRSYRGLTLQAIATITGVSRQAISYWELGENDITVGRLDLICTKAFKTDLVTFFGPLPRKAAA